MLNSDLVKKLAFTCGFDMAGITTPEILEDDKDRLRLWMEHGYHGEMKWIEESFERRTDPGKVLKDVKSIIMLGINYYQPNSNVVLNGMGLVSRYARGKDYHKVIARKTKHLITKLKENMGSNTSHEFYWYVDYGPMLERAYAAKAGLGYIGKNSMLINRTFGSWFFLSEILTTVELEPDEPYSGNHGRCGKCTLCIDACPTGAIIPGNTIDSNKCISYLTIEHIGDIDKELSKKMSNLFFGCDICQEVCPHNSRAVLTRHKEFLPDEGVGEFIDAATILSMKTNDEFLKLTAGTPFTRPKLSGLQRNAAIVLNNSGIDKNKT
ncbi:MAG: tRNA epoxyqueuosine(34) reductase QueG [bacterium]